MAAVTHRQSFYRSVSSLTPSSCCLQACSRTLGSSANLLNVISDRAARWSPVSSTDEDEYGMRVSPWAPLVSQLVSGLGSSPPPLLLLWWLWLFLLLFLLLLLWEPYISPGTRLAAKDKQVCPMALHPTT